MLPIPYVGVIHGFPGKAEPLASPVPPFSATWLVPAAGLQPTSSSNTHSVSADLGLRWLYDLRQNSFLLHSFEVTSSEVTQIRNQKQWAVLLPASLPLPKIAAAVQGACRGLNLFPDRELGLLPLQTSSHWRRQCWKLHVALPRSGNWLLVSASFYLFPAVLHCQGGWALN